MYSYAYIILYPTAPYMVNNMNKDTYTEQIGDFLQIKDAIMYSSRGLKDVVF